jgi:hypothetical protein
MVVNLKKTGVYTNAGMTMRKTRLDSDTKAAKKMWLPWWGVLCVILGAMPVGWLFDHLGRFNLAMPTMSSIAVLGLAIAVKWRLRHELWFWITMTVIAALHILLILLVPWPTKWVPAAVFAGFSSVDLYGMLAIIDVVGKFLERPEISET